MRRFHISEIHEQPWLPSFLRDLITDALQFGLNYTKIYSGAGSLIRDALKVTQTNQIVDLCSGAGGPWLELYATVGSHKPLEVLLTDKYPNSEAFATANKVSNGTIRYSPQSVDASDVPPALKGFRTIFTGFHHFKPPQARAILQNAVAANVGIGIFEVTRRTPSNLAAMVLWALTAFAFAPFIRPFRWSRLLLTYFIPVIPFVLLFDGIVSCARSYKKEELLELVTGLSGSSYQWKAGGCRHPSWTMPLFVTYLTGVPTNTASGHRTLTDEGQPIHP